LNSGSETLIQKIAEDLARSLLGNRGRQVAASTGERLDFTRLRNDAVRGTAEGVPLETSCIQQRKVDVVVFDTAAKLKKLPNRDSSN
jgi:hypothetical protein